MLLNLKLSDKGAYPSWIFHTIVIFSQIRQPNDADDPLPKSTQVGYLMFTYSGLCIVFNP